MNKTRARVCMCVGFTYIYTSTRYLKLFNHFLFIIYLIKLFLLHIFMENFHRVVNCFYYDITTLFLDGSKSLD